MKHCLLVLVAGLLGCGNAVVEGGGAGGAGGAGPGGEAGGGTGGQGGGGAPADAGSPDLAPPLAGTARVGARGKTVAGRAWADRNPDRGNPDSPESDGPSLCLARRPSSYWRCG